MSKNKLKNLVYYSVSSFILFLIITIFSNNNLDKLIYNYINKNLNNALVVFMKLITLLGDTKFILLLFIITIIILIKYKKFNKSLVLGYAIIGQLFLTWLVKNIIQKSRPENALIAANGYSFPSGHATSSVVLYGFLIYAIFKYIKHKKIKIILIIMNILLILLIGFSRIYLNAHWLTDVIAGYMLGFFWLTSSILLINIIIKK